MAQGCPIGVNRDGFSVGMLDLDRLGRRVDQRELVVIVKRFVFLEVVVLQVVGDGLAGDEEILQALARGRDFRLALGLQRARDGNLFGLPVRFSMAETCRMPSTSRLIRHSTSFISLLRVSPSTLKSPTNTLLSASSSSPWKIWMSTAVWKGTLV